MAGEADAISGAALGTADVISGWLTNYHTNKANINLQKDLSAETWSNDQAMWRMQNKYNSPQQQMLRLKQAGLNPNLMYGKGNMGNATTLPKYNKPDVTVQPREEMNMQGQYTGLRQLQLRENAVEASVTNTKAKTLNEVTRNSLLKSQIGNKQYDLMLKELTTGLNVGIKEQNLQNLKQTWSNLAATNRQINASANLKTSQSKLLAGQITMKQFEIEMMKESGMTFQDKTILRGILNLMSGSQTTIRELKEKDK